MLILGSQPAGYKSREIGIFSTAETKEEFSYAILMYCA